MKLSKDFINELKGRVKNKIIEFGSHRETTLLSKIMQLFGHIEALEQELSVKPVFVMTNKFLYSYGEAGCIFEAVKIDGDRWKRVSGAYKGKILHMDHASEINIADYLNQLQQANHILQHNERVLMGQRAALNDDVIALTASNNALKNSLAKADEVILLNATDIRKLHVRARTAENERDAALATIDKAVLDQQPVVLPGNQVDALDSLRNDYKLSRYYIITNLAVGSWNMSLGVHFAEIYGMDRETLVLALANGYTVEQTVDEANEAAFRAGMEAIYKEMDEIKFATEFHWQTELTNRVVELIAEIESKN